MKQPKKLFRTCIAAATLATAFFVQNTQATPYASCITNNANTVKFYLNENGGSVVVTYEDSTTATVYSNSVAITPTNLPSGAYTFSLTGHSSYSIAVTKYGSGSPGVEPNVIQNTNILTGITGATNQLTIQGDPRGVAVNVRPASPYFGRIYVARGGNASIPLWDFNSDGSIITAGTNAGVTTWSAVSPYSSPDRISLAADDYLVVGDWSLANAGVWRVHPGLAASQLLLGPTSDANGKSAGVHGAEVSPPVLVGDLSTGANLLVVDSDLTTPNSLLVYSNLTLATLPRTTAPDLVGPEVAINYSSAPGQSVYLYPSLTVGPSGYIYSGEFRGGVSAGDPASVQIYGFGITNMLWQSYYTNGTLKDYFNTTASGGSASRPTDLAISPDGKYLATVAIDGHLTICSLTNGIPDVSTISAVKPTYFTVQTADGGDEVCWDAADNLYVLSGGIYGLQTWTLGQSFQATTTGNVSGPTGFSMTSLLPFVNVYATNNPVISQANSYGNPTSGSFTIVRTSVDYSQPLTVNFTYSGTATNGTYTAGSTGSVILAAGQTTTNILITAVTDGLPRLTTYLTLTVTANPTHYTLSGAAAATMSILNTAEPYLIASAGAPSMYNAFSNDYGSVVITRWGDTNATTTVNSFTFSGTGAVGTDYTVPTTVTFNPGDLTKTSYVYPLNNGSVPVHNPNLAYTGNKTAIIGIGAGGTYAVKSGTVTLSIIDSATPTATVLFSDPLTDPADAANWGITAANANMGNEPVDTDVEFGSDLTAAPYYAIPFPPNGSQYALKMTVNKGSGAGGTAAATAVNAYLTNHVFSGNYAVRFNMNMIEGNCDAAPAMESGSYNPEEGAFMGINHNGLETNCWFYSFILGAGETSFAADGVFYWISDSGGRYDDLSNWGVSPYMAYTGNGSPSTNAGWAQIGGVASSSFANAFKKNVFTSYDSASVPPYNGGWTEGGPGLVANGSANLGFSVSSWSDVEIKQLGGVVTLSIDKTPIFVYTNTTAFTNGNLMLGYEDPWNGGEDVDTAVYYSNLRVVQIGAPSISEIANDTVNNKIDLDFTTVDADATTSSFVVLSATSVTGPYANATATITQLSGGAFQAAVTPSGPVRFYRIMQKQ